MSNPLEEKLTSILNKVQMRVVTITDSEYTNKPGITIEEAKQAILEAVREIVPLPWSPEGSQPELTDGWNTCRETMLKELS